MKRYKSLFEVRLLEGKQVGVIYHNTTYDNAIKIINSNSLKAGAYTWISTTRNKSFLHKNLPIQIVLDGDKISNNYKIEPYNHGALGLDEQEERIMTYNLKNLKNYIIKININEFSTIPNIKSIIELLKNKNIKFNILNQKNF